MEDNTGEPTTKDDPNETPTMNKVGSHSKRHPFSSPNVLYDNLGKRLSQVDTVDGKIDWRAVGQLACSQLDDCDSDEPCTYKDCKNKRDICSVVHTPCCNRLYMTLWFAVFPFCTTRKYNI